MKGVRKSRSGSTTPCYHRVAEGVDDPVELCVTPAILAAISRKSRARRSRRALPTCAIRRGRPGVVVTLDDGYVDIRPCAADRGSKGVPITAP